jgi:ferrochelatase
MVWRKQPSDPFLDHHFPDHRRMSTRTRTHLLLVNLGTPRAATAESVREFLAEFLSDPSVVDLPGWFWRPVLRLLVLRSRSERVAAAYRSIWNAEGSPLRVATERMVAAVQVHAPDTLTVSAAYRYGEPSLDSEMRRLSREHDGEIVVVPLFPQRTESTTGTVTQRAREAAARAHVLGRMYVRLLPPADPGYIDALAARWLEAMDSAAQPPDHLVVSFHGIPVRYNNRERRQYVLDCEETTSAFLRAVRWPEARATLAYQSKFGPEPWLTPATATVINELPGREVRSIAVITPGFLTDGLETLEEIGIRAREQFESKGGKMLIRVEAPEDHHALASSFVRLALG